MLRSYYLNCTGLAVLGYQPQIPVHGLRLAVMDTWRGRIAIFLHEKNRI